MKMMWYLISTGLNSIELFYLNTAKKRVQVLIKSKMLKILLFQAMLKMIQIKKSI